MTKNPSHFRPFFKTTTPNFFWHFLTTQKMSLERITFRAFFYMAEKISKKLIKSKNIKKIDTGIKRLANISHRLRINRSRSADAFTATARTLYCPAYPLSARVPVIQTNKDKIRAKPQTRKGATPNQQTPPGIALKSFLAGRFLQDRKTIKNSWKLI